MSISKNIERKTNSHSVCQNQKFPCLSAKGEQGATRGGPEVSNSNLQSSFCLWKFETPQHLWLKCCLPCKEYLETPTRRNATQSLNERSGRAGGLLPKTSKPALHPSHLWPDCPISKPAYCLHVLPGSMFTVNSSDLMWLTLIQFKGPCMKWIKILKSSIKCEFWKQTLSIFDKNWTNQTSCM